MQVTTAATSTGRAVDQALVGVGATQYRIPGRGSPLCSRNHSTTEDRQGLGLSSREPARGGLMGNIHRLRTHFSDASCCRFAERRAALRIHHCASPNVILARRVTRAR